MRKMKGWLWLVLALSLVLTGCARLAQERVKREVEKKTGVKIETEERVNLRGLPREFIYPKAKSKGKTSVKTVEGETISISLDTSDSLDRVKNFYDTKPASKGWAVSLKQETGTAVTYMFTKDKFRSTVYLSTQEGKTFINFSYIKSTQ